MIKHVLKMIWNQRKSNSWIFAELLIVLGALWVMTDVLVANLAVYSMPLGYDVRDCYNLQFSRLSTKSTEYVTDSLTNDAEDIQRILTNLRQNQKVENVCLHFLAHSYSPGYWWTTMYHAEADSTEKNDYYYRHSVVSPEYFEVLRIQDKSGKPIRQQLSSDLAQLVITPDIEDKFYPERSAVGQRLKHSIDDSETFPVTAVCSSIRSNEYVKSEPFFYRVQSGSVMSDFINNGRGERMTCIIRMRPGFKADEIEKFLEDMGDRLASNNMYVSGVNSMDMERTYALKGYTDAIKKKLALVMFMLVNVFFGVVGSFWLRIQYRRGELGLRTALGSTRRGLLGFLNLEGTGLLVLTLPFILIFILNMLYFDIPDTANLPYTWWRFGIALGLALLLLSGMILIGVWFPARKVMKMNPAEALHYE